MKPDKCLESFYNIPFSALLLWWKEYCARANNNSWIKEKRGQGSHITSFLYSLIFTRSCKSRSWRWKAEMKRATTWPPSLPENFRRLFSQERKKQCLSQQFARVYVSGGEWGYKWWGWTKDGGRGDRKNKQRMKKGNGEGVTLLWFCVFSHYFCRSSFITGC